MSVLSDAGLIAGRQPGAQLTRSGFALSYSADEVAELRAEFDSRQAIRLPRLLAPELLTLIQQHISRGSFYTRAHGRVGIELCLSPDITNGILHFLMNNNPQLFRFVEAITGCGSIALFTGRVYRMMPGSEHYDSWHSDDVAERLIGMSLNLSSEVFQGSVFQLRATGSDRILCEMANTGFGDAILFRIAPHLLHRITPLEGTVPKTAYAGWFRAPAAPPVSSKES